MCPGNFHQLDFTIKSHHLYPVIDSVLNLRHLFTWICIGNPLWRHPETAPIVFHSCWHSQILSQWQLTSSLWFYHHCTDCKNGGDPRKGFKTISDVSLECLPGPQHRRHAYHHQEKLHFLVQNVLGSKAFIQGMAVKFLITKAVTGFLMSF